MTTARPEIVGKRSGRLNTKQFKIWIDILDANEVYAVSELADKHNYTNREVTTAIGRMPTPPVMFEDGYVWFEGTDEDRAYYRRVLTAERFDITNEMCQIVLGAMGDQWITVSGIACKTGMAVVSVSRTLVVISDRITKKSSAGGVFYKIPDQNNET